MPRGKRRMEKGDSSTQLPEIARLIVAATLGATAALGAAASLNIIPLSAAGTAGPGHSNAAVRRPELEGSIFVGHLAADLDAVHSPLPTGSAVGRVRARGSACQRGDHVPQKSRPHHWQVAAAMAGAELYHGVAAVASKLNSESKWALDYWQASPPLPIEDAIAGARESAGGVVRVCLVDFQQTTQLHAAVSPSDVVGVLDHHALQSKTVVTKKPILVDIRPWGSTSTLIAEDFAASGKTPSHATAGLMLSAVLSDTLNFKSPTTTDRDRAVAARLAAQLEVPSMDGLATLLFDAKSGELAGMSAREIIEADIKEFSFGDAAGRVHSPLGIAVVETTSVTPVLARTEELLAEVRRLKQERSLRVLLLAIVDIVRLETLLLLADADDASLATRAFPDGQGSEGEGCDQHVASACSQQVLAIGAKVSRKLDIVPPVQRTIKRGWVPS